MQPEEMDSFPIAIAFEVQSVLRGADIQSVLTGVWALNYYGVDIVMHDVEFCIPSSELDEAAQVLNRCMDSCRQLPDCEEPDLYQCYRGGAKRFLLSEFQHPLNLYLVPDNKLGMSVSRQMMKRGLSLATAHEELRSYCQGTPQYILSKIAWPSLPAFLGGWLSLAVQAAGTDDEIIYLMYAERIIDANEIDQAWCENNLRGHGTVQRAKHLLAGKPGRLVQDLWMKA